MKNRYLQFSTVLLALLIALPCTSFAKKKDSMSDFSGTLTAVDTAAKTVTVTPKGKKATEPKTFTVADSTRIIIDQKDSDLAGLATSMPVVVVTGSVDTSASVIVADTLPGGKGKKGKGKKKKGADA